MFPLALIAVTWTAVAVAVPLEYRLAAVGESILFECQARDVAYISWDFKSLVAGTDALIYNGRFIKHEYDHKAIVDNDTNNRSRLLLKQVRVSDAGTYRCMNTGGDHLFNAELVVLDGRPECSLNTSLSLEEMTVIGINCTMCTSGIVVPVIKCYDNVTRQLFANASRSNETCNYDPIAMVANEHLHGSRIECTVSVGTKTEVGTDHRWTSPNITVRYGPHRVAISPKEVAYMRVNHADKLRCSADSYPTSEFQWTVTGNPTVGHVGSEYTVDVCKLIYHDISSQCSFTDKAGQSQTSKMTLKCSAFRPDRPERESVDSVHIEIEHLRADCERCPKGVSSTPHPTTPSSLSTLTIAVAAAASLLVLIVVVIAVCLTSHHRRQRLPQPSEHKRPGIYTPNNPFYDDAQSADTDHYSELPPGYSGLQSAGAQYDEIDDNAVTETQLDDGDSSLPLPYQKLSPEQRGQPRQPGVYRQLGDAERVDDGADSQPYLDIINADDDSSPKLSHRLDVELHSPPPGHDVHTGQSSFPEITKFVGEENQAYGDRKRKLTNRSNKTRVET